MNLSFALGIISVFSSFVTIYLGFVFIFEHWKNTWSRRRQMLVALACLVVLFVISVLAVRGKFLGDKEDLLQLRQIADRAYDHGDYDAAIKLTSFALRFQKDDEELYRIRARAYKRLGPAYYPKEIEDRKVEWNLNPARQQNQLFIIED